MTKARKAEARRIRNRDTMRAERAADPEGRNSRAREWARRKREADEKGYLAANAIRTRRRRLVDPERVRAEDREHYRKNAERKKATQRAALARKKLLTPERFYEDNRRWRKALIQRQPRLFSEKNIARYNRHRAKQAGVPGRGVTTREWLEIIELSGGLCSYCAKPCKPTMDHIDAVARGGAHEPENIAVACERCNKSKADKSIPLWLVVRP